MEEKCWKNEVYSFVNFVFIIGKPLGMAKKDHISVKKASIISKNLEVFLTNLAQS